MALPVRRFALAAWALYLAAGCCDADLQSESCPHGDLHVVAAQAGDAALACEGARQALEFLRGLGLRIPADLQIEVVEQLPQLHGVPQLGTYEVRSDRIRVLSYTSCGRIGRDDLLFDQPLDHDLYRSLVAHEFAHAVVARNCTAERPCLVAHEYVAYTTQFAAMSAALRARILGASAVEGFTTEEEMSEMRYLLDPQGFGIAAYRHFIGPGGGPGFVTRLLNGEVDLPHPWGY